MQRHDCPECGCESLRPTGKSYGNLVFECAECGYVEETPDRSVPKKPKIKLNIARKK